MMQIILDVGFSSLRLLLLVLVLALVAAAVSVLLRLYHFSTWLNDVKGPESHSFWMGHYADFCRVDIVRMCMHWMDQYGGAVRHMAFLGEPRLLVTDPVALEHILVKRAYAYTKQPDFTRFIKMLMGPGLLASEGDQHRRQKRAIQAGFAAPSVRAYYPIFLHHARHYRHCLLQYIDEAQIYEHQRQDGNTSVLIDILKPSARVSSDILGHTGFGKPFQALEKDDHFGAVKSCSKDAPLRQAGHPLMRAFDSLIETASTGGMWRMRYDVAVMFVPWLRYLPFTFAHDPRVRQARQTMDDEAGRVLDSAEGAERERMRMLQAEDANHHFRQDSTPIEQCSRNPASIVSFMMRARDQAQSAPVRKQDLRLTSEDLVGQVTTLMLAGHETTSTVLAWFARGLSHNQGGQNKLRQAIQEKRIELGLSPVSRAWTPGEEIAVPEDDTDVDRELTLDELESITYLDWAVQEMLRLHSPVHTSSRTATEDDILPIDPAYSPNAPASGIPIHKGVTFIIPIEAINHDPKLWGSDADEYRPERWGDESLPGVRRFRGQKGGMSFMFGTRSCIGARFSIVELKAILAVLVTSIHFEDSKRTVVRSRWVVARPWDPLAGREQCPVRIARV